MSWGLAFVALALLFVVAISRRLSNTPVTPQMVFLAIGVLIGPKVIGAVDVRPGGDTVRTLAEATLAVVLFADASRIGIRELRREYSLPLRLLLVGLPLTIAAGALVAKALFGALTFAEAAVLAVLLAPTDAALGQAVVVDERLPEEIREGLNVESGLNDGLCVPLLFLAIAAADVESSLEGAGHAFTVAAEEIGFGLLAGVAAGLLAGAMVLYGSRRQLVAGPWRQVAPVAATALAYGTATGLGGSGFIASFVAGICFGRVLGNEREIGRLNEELGDLLGGATFVVFGAVLLAPALSHISWQMAVYVLASLTVVRMLPVAVSLMGSRARVPSVAFIGWFGPRGLASIVFALIVVLEAHLPPGQTIARVAYLTVAASTIAHGLSAAPLADRYGRWLRRQPPGSLSEIELPPGAVSAAGGGGPQPTPG